MSFLDLANKRYSVRNYKNTPIPQENINRCIEAARLAPSACNSQPWKFIIVDDPELINELAKAAFEGFLDFNNFAFKAPVLVLIVSERQKLFAKFASVVKKKLFSLMDIGWFNERKVKKILSIPKLKRVELIISVGFSADEKIPHKKRKSIDEILSYNKYC
ncbi:MAG: nitroreductase family protein [Planctomycetota bacterium]|jgi:nitroreductase